MMHRRNAIPPVRPLIGALVLFLAFLTGSPANAQDQASPSLPLWEVTHEETTVYLLGSVHLLHPDVYPLHDALYEAFDASDVVAFELDFHEMAASAPLMAQRGMYAEGQTLQETLPAELYDELEGHFQERGIPSEMLERMKPWMAALTLSSLAMQEGGYDAESGIDLHFFQRAQEADKDVVAFETMEEQIEVFDGLDTDGQVAFVRSTLEELDTVLDQMDEMTALWKSGNAERLADMLTQSMEDQPALMERLLFERNQNWLPQIEALLETPETAMVIVGMGHLVGEGSVVELLRERGYDVRRYAAGQPVGSH